MPHADLGHELLETLAIDRAGPRLAEIAVDDDDPIIGPAQRDGTLAESILALRALGILDDLSDRRLPDVQIGIPLEVAGRDFLVSFGVHRVISLRPARAMLASSRTRPAWISSDRTGAATHGF